MELRKILIATKTYPSISKKYRETVCTAGVLLDDQENPIQWIRLYPIRYRQLDFDRRYPRWSIINAKIEKNDKDYRKESYRIEDSSIKVIRKLDTGIKKDWAERKSLILPLKISSTQELREQNLSLGLIKPKLIEKSYVEQTSRNWNPKQQTILNQMDLFEPPEELEKIPYKFGYKFIENDETNHRYSISDWEISQLYRKCRDSSKKTTKQEREEEAAKKVKEKLDFLSQKYLYFIVGNLNDHKDNFMVIGLFYPPKIDDHQQLTLSLF